MKKKNNQNKSKTKKNQGRITNKTLEALELKRLFTIQDIAQTRMVQAIEADNKKSTPQTRKLMFGSISVWLFTIGAGNELKTMNSLRKGWEEMVSGD